MPGKQARALCPVCQEALPPDETECRNCGAFVIDEAVVRLCRALGIDRAKALQLFEAGFRHPTQLRDRDVNRVLETRESGLLFLCTNCGSFVATGDPRCARCGAEFEPEETTRSEAAEADILDLILCPNCGADNTPEWTECEICGEPLPGAVPTPEAAPPPSPPAPEPQAETSTGKFDTMLEDLGTALAPKEMTRPEPEVAKTAPLPSPPAAPPPPAPSSAVVRSAPAETAPRRVPPSTPKPVPDPTPRPVPRGASAPPSHDAKEVARAPRPEEEAAPVVSRPAPRLSTDSPRSTAAPETVRTRLVRQPAEIRVRPRAAARSTRRSRSLGARDLVGPSVAAAGLSLVATRAWGPAWAAWGIVFVLAVLAGYGIAGAWPDAILRLRRVEAILLLLGASLGIAALVVGSAVPGVPPGAVLGLAASGALPLALATRRLLGGTPRILLAAAAAAPMTGLAVAVAESLAYASTDAWLVGLLALLPWPAALAVVEIRGRATTFAIRKEITEAERHYAGEDYSRSVEDFDRAIHLTEKASTREELPFYGKGAALIILGRYEEALEAIDRALDINPYNEVAWVNKGNALTKMGRLVDALRSFNAAIKVNPAYEVAWNNKGNALARLGRYEEALRCYEKALELDPDYRGAWVNKGYVLAKLGRYDEAAACADRVLRLGTAPPST